MFIMTCLKLYFTQLQFTQTTIYKSNVLRWCYLSPVFILLCCLNICINYLCVFLVPYVLLRSAISDSQYPFISLNNEMDSGKSFQDNVMFDC